MKTIKIILFIVTILFPVALHADQYINSNCSENGNGTSWACAESSGGSGAFNDIMADISCYFGGYTWVRGETYWIAGSDTAYGSGCIRNTSGTGDVIIKKATVDQHGTDSGWVSAYGEKQAVTGALSTTYISNVTIDGTDPSNVYGIKVVGYTGVTLRRGYDGDARNLHPGGF